jgi:hypothetical protein
MSETMTPAADKPWYTARDWSMWEITGQYPTGNHSFTACLAVVLPGYTHGTERPLFAFVGPLAHLNDVVDPAWITAARPLLLVDRDEPTQAYWEHDQAQLDAGLRVGDVDARTG